MKYKEPEGWRYWYDPDTLADISPKTALEIEYDEMEKREMSALKSPLMMQMLLACYWAKWNGKDIYDYVPEKQWASLAGREIGKYLGKKKLALGCETTEKGDEFVRKMAQTSVSEPFCCVSGEIMETSVIDDPWHISRTFYQVNTSYKPKWSDWVKWTGDRRPVKKGTEVELKSRYSGLIEGAADWFDWSPADSDRILEYRVKL